MIIYWLCGPVSKYISFYVVSYFTVPSPLFIDMTACVLFQVIYPLSNYTYKRLTYKIEDDYVLL